jgi:uncharacterized protein YoxC|tara:strand:+ start:4233 stop:4469 length:237 start_codon:yes stop_codon:yes gene_type:complete
VRKKPAKAGRVCTIHLSTREIQSAIESVQAGSRKAVTDINAQVASAAEEQSSVTEQVNQLKSAIEFFKLNKTRSNSNY